MPRVPAALVKPNAFTFQINNFACTLALPRETDLVNLLRFGADFYHGYLDNNILVAEAEGIKHERLGGMIRCARNPTDLDERSAQGLDFTLKLLHLAMSESWRLPSLLTKHHGVLTWHTGGNRLLASVMAHRDPSKTLPILCSDFDRDHQGFNHVTMVTSDQQLCDILNVPHIRYDQHTNVGTEQTCEMHLEWPVDLPGPCLHYIFDRTKNLFDWSNHTQTQYIHTNIVAIRRMLRNNRVRVFADSPDQVTDSMEFFDIEYAGPGPGKIEDLGPGGLTQLAYRARMFDSIPYKEITVWVTSGRKIDLAELLFWVNTKNNVYVDRDGEFLVMISRNKFSSTPICLSYQ